MEKKEENDFSLLSKAAFDLQDTLNDLSNKAKKKDLLDESLQILCCLNATLKITPIGLKKCCLCKQNFERKDHRLNFPCSCLHEMHYNCFNSNPSKHFKLKNSFIQCKTCKIKCVLSSQPSSFKSNNNDFAEEEKVEAKRSEKELFECSICFEKTSLFITLDCSHRFCKKCLRQYIKNYLEENQYDLINLGCPDERCNKKLDMTDIKKIMFKKEFELYDTKLLAFNSSSFLKKNEKTIRCPQSLCDFFCIIQKDDKDLKTYKCPKCTEEFCVNGCADPHHGLTCKQYQNIVEKEGNKFFSVVRDKNLKLCKNCGAWIEKNKGCNHLTCKCKYEFCYLCGNKWKNCSCPLFGNQSDDDESDFSLDSDEESSDYSDLKYYPEEEEV